MSTPFDHYYPAYHCRVEAPNGFILLSMTGPLSTVLPALAEVLRLYPFDIKVRDRPPRIILEIS